MTNTSTAHAPHIPDVLDDPLLDRGTAFTEAERDALDLTGRLPSAVLTLDQQAVRAYQQLQRQPGDLAKNVFMSSCTTATKCRTSACWRITSPTC